MPEPKSCKVKISVDLNEPALVEAAFDRIRREAGFYGLKDVSGIYIHLVVELEGRMYESRAPYLDARLDSLWLGQVESVEFFEPKEGDSDADDA